MEVTNKQLTLKQRAFVQKYFEYSNATEAVVQAYNVKRRVIAAVMAKQKNITARQKTHSVS